MVNLLIVRPTLHRFLLLRRVDDSAKHTRERSTFYRLYPTCFLINIWKMTVYEPNSISAHFISDSCTASLTKFTSLLKLDVVTSLVNGVFVLHSGHLTYNELDDESYTIKSYPLCCGRVVAGCVLIFGLFPMFVCSRLSTSECIVVN